jgi:cysteine desulfuration protein SufE
LKISNIQNEIIEEFDIFDTWMDKYEYLIELGKSVPKINEENKKEENIIKGCQSKVWLHAEKHDGLVRFYADSDAIITKGIISLLIRTFSNQKPEDIINASLDFIDDIGLRQHLSPNRANGLNNMIKKIKFYAIAFSKTN